MLGDVSGARIIVAVVKGSIALPSDAGAIWFLKTSRRVFGPRTRELMVFTTTAGVLAVLAITFAVGYLAIARIPLNPSHVMIIEDCC